MLSTVWKRITGDGLQHLRQRLTPTAYQSGGIFIVQPLLWQGACVFLVSSEGQSKFDWHIGHAWVTEEIIKHWFWWFWWFSFVKLVHLIFWIKFLRSYFERILKFSPSLGVQLLEFYLFIQEYGEVALVVQVKLAPREICHSYAGIISGVMFLTTDRTARFK